MSPHKHEPTTYSLTDTVVDHGQKRAPPLPDFLPLSPASHPTHPDSDPNHMPREHGSDGPGEKSASSRVPHIIPQREKDDPTRTLVLCFDGTEDQFDNDNTNVVQFVSLLAKKDRNKQMVYYQVRDRQSEISSA